MQRSTKVGKEQSASVEKFTGIGLCRNQLLNFLTSVIQPLRWFLALLFRAS